MSQFDAGVWPGITDVPTPDDHRRLRSARRLAHRGSRENKAVFDAAMLATFRAELGAVVRSASPVLIGLLELDGLPLDHAVALIMPQDDWPRKPRLAPSPFNLSRRPLTLPAKYTSARLPQALSYPANGYRYDRPDGGHLHLQVMDHSLELVARIGRALFVTRFGELRIELADELPEAIVTACLGRMIDEVVDHPALRGRGWPIVDFEDSGMPLAGHELIVRTGSVPYRMPWSR